MIWILFGALLGLLVGHGIRRLVPFLMHWSDKSLPFRYPWPELTCAFCLALVGWRWSGTTDLIHWTLFVTLLMTGVVCDAFCKYIPTPAVLAGMICGILGSSIWPESIIAFVHHAQWLAFLDLPPAGPLSGLLLSVLGLGAGFCVLETFRRIFSSLAGLEAMGFGDTLLLAMIGSYFGPELVLYTLVPASICGIIMGILHKMVTAKSHFPFGPGMAAGALIMLFFHQALIRGFGLFHTWLYHLPPQANLLLTGILVLILVLLMVRLRLRAARYAREIEEDYQEIDEQMQDDP